MTPMQLTLVGINNQTAPIAVREKAAISAEKLPDSLRLLRSHIMQGIILSTCNRTEIYTIADGNNDEPENAILAFMQARMGTPAAELRRYIYSYKDAEAARHLFRLTSGLESLIIGEYEVLGQVRQALEAAQQAGMVDMALRQSFNSAVRTGRRVREETGISRNALSVSSVAVELASRAIHGLAMCRMLVIGAGEAGRLVAKVARERGVGQIVIANRTKDRSQVLAETLGGIPTDLSNLDYELETADIVVTCAGAPHRILESHMVQRAMKNRTEAPLVLIDIAVPRNVDPEVAKIGNVFLYNIDDLTEIANSNRKKRENEIQQAETIVTNEVARLIQLFHDWSIRPTVSALTSRVEEIRLAQLGRTLKKLPPLSQEQLASLEAMTKSIATRIIQEPIQYLKTGSGNHNAEMVKHIFNLSV